MPDRRPYSVITNFGCHWKCPYCIVRNTGILVPETDFALTERTVMDLADGGGMDWVADGTSDSRIYDRLVEEYCDVVEALGTFAIAYGITDEDIRKGMGECEKRFRDGDAGGRKTVEENTIIDGLAELSTRLQKVQTLKRKKPTKLSELEK